MQSGLCGSGGSCGASRKQREPRGLHYVTGSASGNEKSDSEEALARRVPETPPFEPAGGSGGVLVCALAILAARIRTRADSTLLGCDYALCSAVTLCVTSLCLRGRNPATVAPWRFLL